MNPLLEPDYSGGGQAAATNPLLGKEPSLRPYEPSWRDRLAALLMGDGRASPERTRVVEGLMGSRGLGNTGLSVADFVPGGQLLGAQEAVQKGDAQGAALAMLPIPGAAKATSGVKNMGMLSEHMPIKAYHGSPHDFDKFDLSKIGTGEGAQAYGHGLYFAEKEGVARSYRDALSRQASPSDDVAKYWLQQGGNDRERAAALFRDYAKEAGLKPAEIAETAVLIEKPAGHMYEVNIHADPARFLDWDKPLAEHPESVREIMKGQGYHVDKIDLPRRDATTLGRVARGDLVRPDETKRLGEAGIPGIKYLDGGSRAAGDGSRNYVIFTPEIVQIMRKYGVASFAALPPAIQMMLSQGQQAQGEPEPTSGSL